MSILFVINSWAANWAQFMLHSLLESGAVLLAVSALWFLIRKRASVHLGYFLFLLVLIKLLIPIEISVPGSIGYISLQHIANTLVQQATEKTTLSAELQHSTNHIEKQQSMIRQSGMVPVAQDNIKTSIDLPSASIFLLPSNFEANAAPTHALLTITAWMMIGWAVMVVLLFLWLMRVQCKTRTLLSLSEPVCDEDLLRTWERLTKQAGIKYPVTLLQNGDIPSPLVWGLFFSRVIIPADFAGTLSASQMEWVLLHELGHIRRRDLPVKLLQRVLQIVYFWNPVLWAANWMIDQLREYACDDFALTISTSPREDCGEGLLHIVERAAMAPEQVAQGLGLLDTKSYLVKRLRRILDHKRLVQKSLSLGAAIVLIFAAVLTLPNIRAEQISSAGESNKTTVAVKQVPMPAGPLLSGVVRDSASGKTIVGAIVKLILPGKGIYNNDDYSASDAIVIESKTDHFGHYQIMDAAKNGLYRITSKADGYIPYDPRTIYADNFIRIDNAHRGQKYDLALQEGCYVSVKVTDINGNVIEGATVFPIVNEMRPLLPKAKTDANGVCSFGNFKNKASRVIVEKEGYGASVSSDFMPGSKEQLKQITIILKAPGSFSGTATFEDGKPAKNVTLLTTFPFNENSTLADIPEVPKITTQTDSDGHFTFSNLGAGTYPVYTSDNRELDTPEINLKDQEKVELQEGQQKNDIRITLVQKKYTNEIIGRVINPDGQPVINAKIEIRSPSQRFGRSDNNGTFIIKSTDSWQDTEFIATADQYLKYKKLHQSSENPLTIIMQPAGRITGYVFDAEGNPIPNACVSVLVDKSNPNWMETFTDFALPFSTVTGYDGSYSIENLNTGFINISAEFSGYTKKIVKEVEIISGKTNFIDFQMSKGTIVKGFIFDLQNKPITNAVAGLLSKVKYDDRYAIGFNDGTTLTDTVQSNTDGAFSISGIGEKGDEIIVQHPDYAPARIVYHPKTNFAIPIKITMTKGGGIEGTIRDSEENPVSGVTVQAFNSPENLFCYTTATDKNGNYHFDNLPATEFTVRMRNGRTNNQQAATVTAEETQNISFGFGTGTKITGTLFDNGQPIAKTKITIQKKYEGYDENQTSTETDEQGRYTFKAVPAGDWILTYSITKKDGNGKDIVPIDHYQKIIVPQKAAALNVDLYACAYSITAIVTDSTTGKPFPGVVITTDSYSSSTMPAPFNFIGKTDENGTAHFPVKAPLTYTLIAKKDGYETMNFPVTVQPLEPGKFISAVTKEIVMHPGTTSIELNLMYNGKPWPEKVYSVDVIKDKKRYEVELKPVENKTGTYIIKKPPAGTISISLTDTIEKRENEYSYYMTVPEEITVQNDIQASVTLDLLEINYFQIRFKTPDFKNYDGPISFEIPSYPQFTKMYSNIKTRSAEVYLTIPCGKTSVKAIVPGYKPIEFTPKKTSREMVSTIFLELENE